MKSVEDLKKEFSKYFEVMNHLGIYSWVAGGAVRDFFLEKEFKDIDYHFKTKEDRDIIKNYFIRKGFVVTKNAWRHYTISKGEMNYDLVIADEIGKMTENPEIDSELKKRWEKSDTVEGSSWQYDWTINAAAIDSNSKFYCHEDFFDHLSKKELVRISQIDRWPITNSRRLNRLLKKGFTIDKKNLILFLDDQEATFQYRKELGDKKK